VDRWRDDPFVDGQYKPMLTVPEKSVSDQMHGFRLVCQVNYSRGFGNTRPYDRHGVVAVDSL
jgi:hypothetical protein